MKKSFQQLLLILMNVSVCSAQIQIFSPTPEAGEYFGRSVAVHGDYILVGANGAHNELTNDNDAGVAYVFKKVQSEWVFHQKLAEPEIRLYDDFGFTVDIDSNYAIIGAPHYGSSGAAFIYKRDGDNWVRQLKLPEKYRAEFGHSVAISQDYAIVGAIDSKGNGPSWSDRGSAWVYKRILTDNTETWIEVDHLTASDEFDRAHFGHCVDINDNFAVVSAWTGAANENYNRSGVYVFERINDSWNETMKLSPEDEDEDKREQFGWNFALFNNQIIVGTPQDSINELNYGSAYIYEYEIGDWVEKAKINALSNNVQGFGRSVAINENTAVIGALHNDQGAAFVFKKVQNEWQEVEKIFNPDINNNGFVSYGYGESVSISKDQIVVGHYDHAEKETLAGSAFIYDISEFEVVTSIVDLEEPSYCVYPNPANNFIYLRTENTPDFSGRENDIQIIDLEGKIIMRTKAHFTGNLLSLNVNSLNSGIYVLLINSRGKLLRSRIIIDH